jgi:hypothetical protein
VHIRLKLPSTIAQTFMHSATTPTLASMLEVLALLIFHRTTMTQLKLLLLAHPPFVLQLHIVSQPLLSVPRVLRAAALV